MRYADGNKAQPYLTRVGIQLRELKNKWEKEFLQWSTACAFILYEGDEVRCNHPKTVKEIKGGKIRLRCHMDQCYYITSQTETS